MALEGPDGPIPFQLSEVELCEDTETLLRATIWFVADLEPFAEDTYTLRYSPEASDSAEPLQSDFEMIGKENGVEMISSGFGVRLRTGKEQFEPSRPAPEVPGPLEAFRLKNGTWFGGSNFYGETSLRSWSGIVTARGPVFGQVDYEFHFANGNRVELAVRLFSRSDRVQIDAETKMDMPREGLRIDVSSELPPLSLHVQKVHPPHMNFYPEETKTGDWVEARIADLGDGPLAEGTERDLLQKVSPWGPWWDDRMAPVVRLGIGEGERELHIARREPAAWVVPASDYAFAAWHPKQLPIRRTTDGTVYIDLNFAAGEPGGVRRFDIADSHPTEAVGWRPHRLDHRGNRGGSQVILYEEPLNTVKDYILEWPGEVVHPRLFVSPRDVENFRPDTFDQSLVSYLQGRATDAGPLPHARDSYALAYWLVSGADPVMAEELDLPDRLRRYLGSLGDFDKMRHTVRVAALYDALIDSGVFEEAEQRKLRAQMAYLAYQIAHPATWSLERGWRSGNLNMTTSYAMLARAAMAATLADHPDARQWMESAMGVMEEMLETVGPHGEWPESSGYSDLSVFEMFTFAVMASRAGFGDTINDPRLKRAVEYLVKIRTPPDPRVEGIRDNPRYGRAAGQRRDIGGAMARAMAESDPEFFRELQWIWLDMHGKDARQRPITLQLGGFEYLYLDPGLPAQQPEWKTEAFPLTGAVFRSGLGTDQEHYAFLGVGDHPTTIYPSQTGALIALFAYGQPVAGSFFGRYGYQNEFLVNRVSLMRSPEGFDPRSDPLYYRGRPRGQSYFAFEKDLEPVDFETKRGGASHLSTFVSLPRQDYATIDSAMKYPENTRLQIPDDLPWPELIADESWAPVWWRRQTLFLKDPDPAEPHYWVVRDTVKGGEPTMWTFWSASEKVGPAEEAADRESFLADAPGPKITEPRELQGDRFTAVGQWGVDLDYYIVAPKDTPRHTLRWGRTWRESPILGVVQYQDLLHLQLPDDGSYYVVLYPRRQDAAPPEFSNPGDGPLVQISDGRRTDLILLSPEPVEAEADGFHFAGTAVSVQYHDEGTAISFGAAGTVASEVVRVESGGPVTFTWNGPPDSAEVREVRLDLPDDHEVTELLLSLPEQNWKVSGEEASLEGEHDALRLTVPSGVSQVRLQTEKIE